MWSKRRFRWAVTLTLGTLPQVVMGAGPVSIPIDRAEVEQVRAGIRGRTIIVDWHGTWDYSTIQGGLDASTNGDTIIVLPSAGSPGGAYVENIIFPARAVTLRSINPDDPGIVAATVIDGNASGSVVSFAPGTPAEAALDGFTITNGRASYGGGLYLDSSSPTIANNTITGNSADRGGGLYLKSSSSPSITNNTITGNSADRGGGLYLDSSSPTIANNTITDNSTGYGPYYGQGGGLYLYYSSPTITNNTITGNSASPGGGLYLYYSSPTIANNTITSNSAFGGSGGGLYLYYSSPTITNNTITGNSAYSGGGLYLYDSSPTIANNTIMGNGAYRGGGLYLDYYSPTIANNTITGNSAYDSGGGLYLRSSFSSTIANNTITGNSASSGGGLYLYHSSPTIANNTVTGNSASSSGGGLYVGGNPTIANTIVAFNSSGVYLYSGSPTLRNNCVYGNTAYNYLGLSDPSGTNGNISVDPLLADMEYGNAHLQPDSPCADAGNNAYALGDFDIDGQLRIQPAGGTVDIGADESDGTVWPGGPYVIVRVSPQGNDAQDGSSWALAKRTVQAGIDAAGALGGEVWVQGGTYYEQITLHAYAYVYGGFEGSEMQRDQRGWSENVTTLDGQQQGSVVTARAGHRVSAIDGFTITNGSASSGGGLYLRYSSPTIANNTITGNSASDGGGLYLRYSSPTIANNTITGNSAYYASGGGLFLYYSLPTLANNTITGNSAIDGGGLYLYSSSPSIMNTIVAFNSSGVYRYSGGTPMLRYNCIYGNTAYNYSGLTDPTGTGGNISVDPQFVDAAAGNLSLSPGSLCIDAGSNGAVVADTLDLDGDGDTTEPIPYDLGGDPRFVDDPGTPDCPQPGADCGLAPIVDMGAYEFQGTTPYLVQSVPSNQSSLWRTENNTIRLTFGADITVPQPGQVRIQEMLPDGAFGPDLSTNGFTFTVEDVVEGAGESLGGQGDAIMSFAIPTADPLGQPALAPTEAAGGSPGRQPWVTGALSHASPEGATERYPGAGGSFAPPGLETFNTPRSQGWRPGLPNSVPPGLRERWPSYSVPKGLPEKGMNTDVGEVTASPRILRIRENGSVLAHRTWYAIRNLGGVGGWVGVGPFEVQYVVQVGDVNNDGKVLANDLSAIFPKIPTDPAGDQERADVNGDGHVLANDLSAVFPHIPSPPVPKPSGH